MKKLFLALAFALSAGLLLAAESPSLDGRALVADDGIFPKGLFAKTVGYLPGDSISVTNPANSERIDILVIGSLDPSEGVAILLSPEAADALDIKKNANNLVKLTKRSGAADEVVNGSAVLTSGPSAEPPAQDEKTVAQIVEEALENNVPVDEAIAEAVEEAEEKIADEEFDKAEKIIADEERLQEELEQAEKVAEIDEGEEEIALIVEDESEYPQYEEPVVDELALETEDEGDDFIEATVKDEPAAAPQAEIALSDIDEELLSEKEPLDEYDAIVLVPSAAKAPEAAAVAEEAPAKEPEIVQAQKAAEPSRNLGVSYLSGYSELEAQKYYVQIAVYNKAEYVNEIAERYSELYPITVIQSGAKSPVLVGPLNVDEYGAVLERFKSYGFKDAFVKVGTSQGPAKKASYRTADFER